ncbi:rhodanese-like domain-containing protein [Thiorhodovibrio frisius]|uniref:Rhodanese-related sulfurtransferase n=1 Tax=Thiorhodovibrio frisius TaxID=631362 RepID=H8YY34_9GAMM|nr:rhodanese-like domain-containing protein [Thiorhodovibrio frisius]EIC23360.1 Rhodanese-related sulfurtransferase [Thiorhodovibrio frisius]WPL23559.1 putative adenylyltransferase/sulfurtransferase MoeZ [Thiorhodovibrio frisius]
MVREIDSDSLKLRLGAFDNLQLVDIRTPEEVAQGVIPQATHVPMHLLPLRQTELPRDRDLVIYCRSGARSYHACQFLMQQGFDNVINLRGGIIDWARQGFGIGVLEKAG